MKSIIKRLGVGIDELDDWAMNSHTHIQIVYVLCFLVGYMIAVPLTVLLAILGGLMNGITICMLKAKGGKT